MPGGVGVAIKAGRAAEKVDDVADLVKGAAKGADKLNDIRKGADKTTDAVKTADKINEGNKARKGGELGESAAKKADELSPSNYPNPDPSMDAPSVKYDPKTNEELMRMRNGQGPTTKKTHGTQNIEAHHRNQVPKSKGGKIDEITADQHRLNGNHTRHSEPSQLTPKERSKEIREHYIERSKEYVTGGEGI